MDQIVKSHDTKRNSFWKGLILPVLLFIFLLLFLAFGVRNVASASDKENMKILQEAVLRATVQCYAIEGMYPPDIKYLEDNYGIVYDHDRYIVHYEVFAGNILPDITVIDLNR